MPLSEKTKERLTSQKERYIKERNMLKDIYKTKGSPSFVTERLMYDKLIKLVQILELED